MFIRTKDERILDYKKMNEISKLSIDMALMEKEIDFNFADTIEELCDEFVYNNQLLYPRYIDPKDTELIAFRYRIEDEFNYKNHKEIYGAIWTNKGLIYVAKVKGVSQNCEINWELL